MNYARQSYERHIAPFARPFAESTVRHALRSGSSSNVVLDHGAGTGLVTSLLLRRRPDSWVVALDPNADLLSALADERRCILTVGTARDLSEDGPLLDLVVSNLVLPFCPDASGDLAVIRERTSSTGTLVVTTLGAAEDVSPFYRFWTAVSAVLPNAWEPGRYPHHRFGHVDALGGVLEQGGWTVESRHRVRAVRRISADHAWTWLSSVLPVGIDGDYRALVGAEFEAVRAEFMRRWSSESRWISGGWTFVASVS